MMIRWTLATTAGWVGGIPLVLLFAGIGGLLGVGDQFSVGIGVGLGVGLGQWLVGRRLFPLDPRWFLASAVGMGLPFILADLLRLNWSGDTRLLVLATVALGALLTGIWQRPLLRPFSTGTNWWPAASVAGWCCAALVASLASGQPRSTSRLLFNVGALVSGGVVLGLMTGGALIGLSDSTPDRSPRARQSE